MEKEIVIKNGARKNVDDRFGADSIWEAMRRAQIEEGADSYDLTSFANERRALHDYY